MTVPAQETLAVSLATLKEGERFVRVSELGRQEDARVFCLLRHQYVSDNTRSVVALNDERGKRSTLDSATQVIRLEGNG